MNNFILVNAISLANEAHSHQTDLADMPYILHPLHVMDQVETIEEKIVAVLHDVTEDTKLTLDEVIIDISDQYNLISKVDISNIKDALKALDKNNFENYHKMIMYIGKDPLAKKIKIQDLKHNMDLKRIIGRKNMTQKDMERFKKYMMYWSYLKC